MPKRTRALLPGEVDVDVPKSMQANAEYPNRDAERYDLWLLGLTEDDIAEICFCKPHQAKTSVLMVLRTKEMRDVVAARNAHLQNRFHAELEAKAMTAMQEMLDGNERGWVPRNAALTHYRKVLGLDTGGVQVNVSQQNNVITGANYESVLQRVRAKLAEPVEDTEAVAEVVANEPIEP